MDDSESKVQLVGRLCSMYWSFSQICTLLTMTFLIVIPCMKLVLEGVEEELRPYALLVEI